MSSIVDSYSESNRSANALLSPFDDQGGAQSFTSDGSNLTQTTFYVKKTGSPTGDVTSKLYAHAGTFGSSSVPTGAALATSTAIDASAFPASLGLVDFTFDGTVNMESGTKYVIAIEYGGGSLFDYVEVGYDGTSPTHDGNNARLQGGSWTASASRDLAFYVYGTPTLRKHEGFLGTLGRFMN